MEDNHPFSESKTILNLDPRPDFFDLTKIGLEIDCSKLRFQCNSKPTDTINYYYSDREIEQAILGYSVPIDNEKTLNNSVFLRQPYTNRVFKDKEIYIHIREKKKPENFPAKTNRHYLTSHDSIKLGQQTTFNWAVDDRSLFTRLCFLQSSSSKLFLTIRLGKDDNYFKDILDKGDTKISEFIVIESLQFHFN